MWMMLHRRGRPTSVVLLFLMVVPQLALALSRHPSLGLHNLLRFVRASRGLVALCRVEVLQADGMGTAVKVEAVGTRRTGDHHPGSCFPIATVSCGMSRLFRGSCSRTTTGLKG